MAALLSIFYKVSRRKREREREREREKEKEKSKREERKREKKKERERLKALYGEKITFSNFIQSSIFAILTAL